MRVHRGARWKKRLYPMERGLRNEPITTRIHALSRKCPITVRFPSPAPDSNAKAPDTNQCQGLSVFRLYRVKPRKDRKRPWISAEAQPEGSSSLHHQRVGPFQLVQIDIQGQRQGRFADALLAGELSLGQHTCRVVEGEEVAPSYSQKFSGERPE